MRSDNCKNNFQDHHIAAMVLEVMSSMEGGLP